MGTRQNNLEKIFKQTGHTVESRKLIYPTRSLCRASKYSTEILRVYKLLGGRLDEFPLRLKPWDIEVDGIAVELDEEQHFNRYRALTLQSLVYSKLPGFPLIEYKQYCEEYESRCLAKASHGGYWSNKSCEMQFGEASKPGVLDARGSSRWKQRAFYDFVRDMAPLLIEQVHFVRISIWDRVSVDGRNELIGIILDNCNIEAGPAIYELVKKRS